MFDIGFFELLIIAVVGLVIIGPERLPETARAIGLWLGRVKRSLRETRSEIEKQLGADDIRRQLHNEEVMRSLEATRRQIQDAVQEGVIEDRPGPAKRTSDGVDHSGTKSETSTETQSEPEAPTGTSADQPSQESANTEVVRDNETKEPGTDATDSRSSKDSDTNPETHPRKPS